MGLILFSICNDNTALLSMFVFVCSLCDIQSYGTSIAVWGETSITGFVLHASEAHCSEMSVPSLICVSTHATAALWDTSWGYWCWRSATENQSITQKKRVREGKEGGEKGKPGGGEQNNGGTALHGFKGYLSQWSHCQAPCLYIRGGNQTHAKLINEHGRGGMSHH